MKPNVSLSGKALVLYQAVVCQKLRKEKGMTIRQIAEVVGLSAMTVWRRLKIETPYSNPWRCNFSGRAYEARKKALRS